MIVPDKLKVAAVGLGWVTTNRHIPSLQRHPGIELIGIVSSDPDRVERVAAATNPRYTAVCNDGQVDWLDEVDAVVIGTDPMSHYPLVKTMLENGKHVLSEKPMAMSVEEGQAIAELASRKELTYGIVHNFQFARSVTRLKQMITGGELGDIESVWAIQLSNHRRRLPVWYEELPLGLFYDESPHLLYLINAVVPTSPEFVEAHVVKSAKGRETPASVTAHFKSSNIPIQVSMHFEAPVSEWHLIVMGSEKLAVADIFRDILVTTRNDGLHLGRNILLTSFDLIRTHLWGTVTSGLLLLQGKLDYGNDTVVARFEEAAQHKIAPQNISAVEALRVLEFQHAIIQSS